MFALPPSHSDRRGQAIVEMAIILPLLVVLLVMAIDAGRIFFGWVALQNASRIGADYAATQADAWNGNPAKLQDERDYYAFLVRQDLQALGCQGSPIPPPNFDPDGDGITDFTDGALVRVELECDFGLLTPLAESFLGSPATLHARSDFAINRTIVLGLPPPGNPPPPPPPPPGTCVAPDFFGYKVNSAQALWKAEGFTTTVGITRPPNGNYTIGSQSPLLDGDSGSCTTTYDETVGP